MEDVYTYETLVKFEYLLNIKGLNLGREKSGEKKWLRTREGRRVRCKRSTSKVTTAEIHQKIKNKRSWAKLDGEEADE